MRNTIFENTTSTPFRKSNYTTPVSDNLELSGYVRKINSVRNLEVDEETELVKKAQSGDKNSKNKLIEANLKLVVTLARKVIYMSKIPYTDLIQEGNMGLMIAIEKFNPNLGYRFSTYAGWWIKQAMFKAISEQSHCVKIPVYIQETLSKFSKIKTQMEQDTNKTVSNREVAEQMNVEPDKIDLYLSSLQSTVSLEGSFDAKNGSELNVADVVADENSNVEENIELEELKREISTVMSILKEREQTVIKMRFGLENFTKTTLEEIGRMFGVTKECIRITEKKALSKMRNNISWVC